MPRSHTVGFRIDNSFGILRIGGIFDGKSTDGVVTCMHIEIEDHQHDAPQLLDCEWIVDHYLIDSWTRGGDGEDGEDFEQRNAATLDLKNPPLWMADHILNKGGLSVLGTHQIRYRFASLGDNQAVAMRVTCCIDDKETKLV